ncbi:unnamed protein product [Arabis nemorensis]|uniref:Uncharacterized protein n=1 Tax=Arabis nemorensis TaxID=586526 RepID=A0A565BEN8_9BRAS|nr:unnamed protein product [Arabis nemorensis]
MMHTDFSGLGSIFQNMLTWLDHNPHPARGMLISDDPAAFLYVHSLDEGRSNSVIPAYPPEDGTSSGVWRWKTILEEAPLLKTPSQMLDHKCAGEPRYICTLCNFKIDDYEDFAEDLFGDAHDDQHMYRFTHFPPNEIDIFVQFRKDKVRMIEMLELEEQESLSSEHPDKDDAQSENKTHLLLCYWASDNNSEPISHKTPPGSSIVQTLATHQYQTKFLKLPILESADSFAPEPTRHSSTLLLSYRPCFFLSEAVLFFFPFT